MGRHGRWRVDAPRRVGLVAPALDTSAGMGVWMTVLGGVLGIVAGVLAFLDQK